MKKSKYAFTKEAPKISHENAFPQVMKLLNRYNIDIEAIEDKAEKSANEKMVDNFLGAIMRGEMEVFEEGDQLKVKQFVKHQGEGSNTKEIIYRELDGDAQDKMPAGDDITQYAQVTALMGILCDASNGSFVVPKLKSSDRKNMLYLGLIFLAQ